MSQAEIARQLGVSEAAVSKWKKALEAHGKQGLESHRSSGRPGRLSGQQKRVLVEKVEGGARAAGFESERWTQARVRQVIEREFDVQYHPNYISQLLHALGLSVQKPEKGAVERDEELVRAWLERDWPGIKKVAAARRRDRV